MLPVYTPMLSHLFFLLGCSHLSVKLRVNTCSSLLNGGCRTAQTRYAKLNWLPLNVSPFSFMSRKTVSFHFLPPSSGTWAQHLFKVRGLSGFGLPGSKGLPWCSLHAVPPREQGTEVLFVFYLLFPQVSKDLICPVIALYSLRWTPSSCCLPPRMSVSLWG